MPQICTNKRDRDNVLFLSPRELELITTEQAIYRGLIPASNPVSIHEDNFNGIYGKVINISANKIPPSAIAFTAGEVMPFGKNQADVSIQFYIEAVIERII